jgi:hypothetical protein
MIISNNRRVFKSGLSTSWENVGYVGNNFYPSILVDNTNTIWAGSTNYFRKMYYSTDVGKTWQASSNVTNRNMQYTLPLYKDASIMIVFATEENGQVAGADSVVYSEDNAVSFTEGYVLPYFQDFKKFNDKYYITTGGNFRIISSVDGKIWNAGNVAISLVSMHNVSEYLTISNNYNGRFFYTQDTLSSLPLHNSGIGSRYIARMTYKFNRYWISAFASYPNSNIYVANTLLTTYTFTNETNHGYGFTTLSDMILFNKLVSPYVIRYTRDGVNFHDDPNSNAPGLAEFKELGNYIYAFPNNGNVKRILKSKLP